MPSTDREVIATTFYTLLSGSALGYAIPFLLWMTPDWQAKLPLINAQKLDSLPAHLIFYTWVNLAGLYFNDFEASKSLINSNFNDLPLLVGDPDTPKSPEVLPKAL